MNYSTIPLQLSTVLGAGFSVVGFIAAIAILIRKLVDPGVQVGWSSTMCIILIVAGITFLMMGIIGEYVGKLIMTMNQTPLYVVRDTLNTEKGQKAEETVSEKDETTRETKKLEKIEKKD